MKKLGIYIHIPFCVKKCDYCDFLSAPQGEDKMKLYVDALIKEIECNKENMEGYIVDTVFIGGGTPSILEEHYIAKIIKTLEDNCNFSEDVEITIECNPGTVTEKKLLLYRSAGINRISFGLQSTDNNELKSIGRIHTYEDFLTSYELARKCGFNNINVDLMSALPGQNEISYKETVQKIAALNTEHISAYSLIVEEGTKMYDKVKMARANGENILPDEDEERKMYYLTKSILEEAGYKRYEISNYAKSGYECRHNIGYWIRKEYLGFGIGAASLYKNKRHNNITDIDCYINRMISEKCEPNCVYEDIQTLSIGEEMEEFMFLGLRMTEGISINDFRCIFGENYQDIYGEISDSLVEKGLLEYVGEHVRLTERGIDVSNYVMSEFLF